MLDTNRPAEREKSNMKTKNLFTAHLFLSACLRATNKSKSSKEQNVIKSTHIVAQIIQHNNS
jgi:hypothetical protein